MIVYEVDTVLSVAGLGTATNTVTYALNIVALVTKTFMIAVKSSNWI